MTARTTAPKKGKKYLLIYAELRQTILSGDQLQVGDKLPSESEMVKRFAASRPTVGRALSQLEADGLITRRAGSGTFVNAHNDDNGFVFGLLIPELGLTEIFEPICQGISRARMGGHNDLLWGPVFEPGATSQDEAERLCEYFIKKKVSGIFFAPLEFTQGKDEANRRIAKRLDDANIPVILLDRDICEYPQRSRYDLVGIDNQRAGYVITEHVLSTGAERLLFFAGPRSAPTVKARMFGYASAIRAASNKNLEVMSEFGDAGDAATVRALLVKHRPDAIICSNDVTAAHLMTTLHAIGTQVPAQLKITGIDNVKYASLLRVPLTTVHQPCAEIGATALMAMLDRLAHPGSLGRDFLVDFRLIIRQSTQTSTFAAGAGEAIA